MKRFSALAGIFMLLVGLIVVNASVAHAGVFESETFDSGWSMGTEWTADRRAPSVVNSVDFDGDYRLHFGISGADKTDTWRDFEGIKHQVDMPESKYQSFKIDLYLGSDWGQTNRNAGLWAQGQTINGDLSAWPILVYRNSGTTTAGFYSYDYIDGAWDLFQSTESSDYGAWHELRFDLNKGLGVEYFVDGTSLGLFADTVTADLSHVILNAYNFGVDDDIYFDNFEASAVPVPAAVWLLGSGLLGLFGVRRKMRG